jgi:hypothetical protein
MQVREGIGACGARAIRVAGNFKTPIAEYDFVESFVNSLFVTHL